MLSTKFSHWHRICLLLVFVLASLTLSLPVQANEYSKKVSKLNSVKSRIEIAEEQIQQLIKAKSQSDSEEKKREIIRQMVTAHNDMKKDIEEYNRLRAEVKYRFPNKGEDIERRYVAIGQRSLEELERGSGLDQVLDKTKAKIEKKYRSFQGAESRTRLMRPEANGSREKEKEEAKRLRLVQ